MNPNNENNGNLILDVLASSVAIANGAGEIVRSIFASGSLNINEKTGKNDLQTRADRSASDSILISFKRQYPHLNVVSEEGDALFNESVESSWIVTDKDPTVYETFQKKSLPDQYKKATMEDLTVWVDPLDGTKEYTEGHLDHVTVLIGIALGDQAVAGVIHQPYFNYKNSSEKLGRTIFAVLGAGVDGYNLYDKTQRFIKKDPPSESKIITTTRSHSTGLVGETIDVLKPTEILRVGGAGHKVLLLLDGLAHAYVFPTPGTKKWDTCAPEAILHAAGGKMTDIKGQATLYKKGSASVVNEWGCLATSKAEDHEEYVNSIPKELSDQVKDYFKNRKR